MIDQKYTYFSPFLNGFIPYIYHENFIRHCSDSNKFSIQLTSFLDSKIFETDFDSEIFKNTICPNIECEFLFYTDLFFPGFDGCFKYYKQKMFPVPTKGGTRLLTPQIYSKIITSLSPKYAQIPSLYLPLNSRSSLYHKSFNRSVDFISECLSLLSKNNIPITDNINNIDKNNEKINLKNKTKFLATVVGANDFDIVKESIKIYENFNDNIAGYIIENYREITIENLNKFNELLPYDKPRIVLEGLNFDEIINAVDSGITVFSDRYVIDCVSKFIVLNPFPSKNTHYSIKDTSDLDKPLVENCMCYTCKNYLRYYVKHLVDVNEMVGSILIFIHNFNVFRNFFIYLNNNKI